jgi:ComF family protein
MLSNFLRAPTLQALKSEALTRFNLRLGQDCMLCLASCGTRLLCHACTSSLPRIACSCRACGIPLEHDAICGECLSHPFAFDAALSCFEYRFPLDRLVQRFKFSGDLAIGRWLAWQLADRVADARADLVVAPPLTRARLRQRGFNQALEIAKVVARRVGARCDIDGISRLRDTAPQAGLRRRERRANLRGAFRCNLNLDALHVAVVDDVMTTGATLDAMASALKERGAARVSAWSVARTVR